MLVPSASGMFTQDGCPHPAARSYRQWPRFAVDVTSAAPVRPHTD